MAPKEPSLMLLFSHDDSESLELAWTDTTDYVWGNRRWRFETIRWRAVEADELARRIHEALVRYPHDTFLFAEGDACDACVRAHLLLHTASSDFGRVTMVILDSPRGFEAEVGDHRNTCKIVVLRGGHDVSNGRMTVDEHAAHAHGYSSIPFATPPRLRPLTKELDGHACAVHVARYDGYTFVCIEGCPRFVVRWIDTQRQIRKLDLNAKHLLSKCILDGHPVPPYEYAVVGISALFGVLLLGVTLAVLKANQHPPPS